MEPTILGLVLIALGALLVVRPNLITRLQIWGQHAVMGEMYESAPPSHTIFRIVGVICIVLGLLLLAGII